MIFFATKSIEKRKKAELLVLPFWQSISSDAENASQFDLPGNLKIAIESGDFKGKQEETLLLYSTDEKEQRVLFLGLGEQEKVSVESLRRSFASLIKFCHHKKLKELNIVFPSIQAMTEEQLVRGIVEGLLLANYSYDKLKHDVLKSNPTVLVKRINFIGIKNQLLQIAKKYALIAEGVYFARDLVNGNADFITPQYLNWLAKSFAAKFPKVKALIFDKKRIEKEKMGLLLAVNRGSLSDPAFIVLKYQGNVKSSDHTVLVGKGVTFDTGGLNLKPTGGMETMKSDMGGAATILGTLLAVVSLGLKINLTVVIAATENAISHASYKPGDVYTSLAGKTVEIINTDAEGRLILADALAYSVKYLKPTRMIDVATLTGAMDIALGKEVTGMMSNQDALADALIRAGFETHERVCRLPLYEEYRESLNSDIADIRNRDTGRSAGAIKAAIFLKEFVKDIPWAHFDIASTAFYDKGRFYHPKYGTGIGVRLLVEFLEQV